MDSSSSVFAGAAADAPVPCACKEPKASSRPRAVGIIFFVFMGCSSRGGMGRGFRQVTLGRNHDQRAGARSRNDAIVAKTVYSVRKFVRVRPADQQGRGDRLAQMRWLLRNDIQFWARLLTKPA